MFNDRYGLTQEVLNGDKTQTRRVCKEQYWSFSDLVAARNGVFHFEKPKYEIGEVVAIAQSYHDLVMPICQLQPMSQDKANKLVVSPGWSNKLYIRADLMPHQIRITDIKVEQMQEISDEDCVKEGILETYQSWYEPQTKEEVVGSNVVFVDNFGFNDVHNEIFRNYPTIKEAFAELIDRISGKGTWGGNPWVFVYTFELIK